MLGGEITVGVGSAHGYEVVAGPYEVTEVGPGRRLVSLDNRDAVAVYTEALAQANRPVGEIGGNLGTYPLGVRYEDRILVRYPPLSADGRRFEGFSTGFKAGDQAYVLAYDPDRLAPSAREATDQAERNMIDHHTVAEQTICYSGKLVTVEHEPDPVGAISFFCIGRSSRGAGVAGEVAAVESALPAGTPAAITYCAGEICTLDAQTAAAQTSYLQLSACTLVIGVPTR
jgi:hypothetical protein